MTRRHKRQSFALLLLLVLSFANWQVARANTSCQGMDFAIDASPPFANDTSNVATGDFNRDGKMDVVFRDIAAQFGLAVRLGDGQGHMGFPLRTFLTSPTGLMGIAVGDVNGDGLLDVAIGCHNENNITVSYGDGTGYFPETVFIPAGDTGDSIIGGGTADLNGDGKNDLVVIYRDSNVIRILSSNWNGRLVYSAPYAVGNSPRSVATGDFNGDGKVDLAVANHDSSDVSVLYGATGGGLSQAVNYSVPYMPYGVVAADFNHDGKADLAVGSDAYVSVRLSDATGFDAPVSYAAYAFDYSRTMTVGDVNGDGHLDIATIRRATNGSPGGLSILRGDGTGRFVTALSFLRGKYSIASADFNGDGRTDLVLGTDTVELLTSKCAPPSYKIDYDGDNKTDIAVWRPSNGNWYIFNSGYESVRVEQWGLGSLGDVPVPGDYDGDGKTDVAVFRSSAGAWYIHRSSDNSTQIETFGSPGDKPVQGDYDGDGKADIAVWRPASGAWYIQQSSDGAVRAQAWGLGDLSDQPAQADFDGDGKTDLAVVRTNEHHWYVLNSSNGAVFDLVWGIAGDVPLVYTMSGKAQVGMWRKNNNTWYVYQNGFSTIQGIGEMPVPGDYDGDNLDDYALWRAATGVWSIKKTGQFSEPAFQFGSAGDIPVSVPYQLHD